MPIFMISPRCRLLLHHDIYEFTEMPSFVTPMPIFMNSPRCHSFVAPMPIFLISPTRHLLLRHDTFDFTAMPSFVVQRYFCFHRAAFFCRFTRFLISPSRHLLALHDIFKIARTSFAWKPLTTIISGARLGGTDVEMPQNVGAM